MSSLTMHEIIEMLRDADLRDDEGGVISGSVALDAFTKMLDFIESSFPWETPISEEGRRLSMQFVDMDVDAGDLTLRCVSWERDAETGGMFVTNILENICAFPHFRDPRGVSLLEATKMLFEQVDPDDHKNGILPRTFFLTGTRDPMHLKTAETSMDFFNALKSRLNKRL